MIFCCFYNFFYIGNLSQVQLLSNLGTNLSCVTVDSLTTCDDQIIADVLQRCCNDAGCSISIGTTEFSCGYQVSIITTHSQCFSQCNVCLRGAHGNNCYCAAQLFFDSQCSFDTCLVVMVDDRRYTVTNQCACFGVNLYFNCIGNLFDTN